MTSRFGSKANEEPGDVYSDLFRRGNQNRGSGNKESLWVIQMEVDVLGGHLTSTGNGGHQLERFAGPVAWLLFTDPDGKPGMLGTGFSDYNAGGRGVAFMMNTDYFINTIWESDFDNDIRNAPHNIVRDVFYNNPASAYFGLSALTYPSPTHAQPWRWYPWPAKITTPGDHPEGIYENRETGALKTPAGATYTDQYLLRLAETYLLRAEAHFKNGSPDLAADDINMVRARANAKNVLPGDVTLDYILDERARELVYEEQRRITLQRTGTLVERVRKYNPGVADFPINIEDYNEVWPIPFAEIEANVEGDIKQNPGYN